MSRFPRRHLRVVGPDDRPDDVVTIDCDLCVMQDTDACDDCLVSYLVDHDRSQPIRFDPEERRAVDLLTEAGLVPPSKFCRRHGVA